MGIGEAAIDGGEAEETLPRRLSLCLVAEHALEAIEHVKLHGLEQRLPVSKVFVEGRRLHAGLLGNGADRQRLRSLGLDQPEGDGDQFGT